MGMKAPDFSSADNPAANSDSFMTRSLTFLFLPVFNFFLMLYPQTLSFDWYVNAFCIKFFISLLTSVFVIHRSMESIPPISSPFDLRNLLTMTFYSCLIILSKRMLEKRLSRSRTTDLIRRKTASLSDCASCAWHSTFLHNNNKKKNNIKQQVLVDNSNNNNNNNHVVCTCPSRDLLWFKTYSSGLPEETEATEFSCKEDRTLLSLMLLVIPFIPATNMFFYVGFVVAG